MKKFIPLVFVVCFAAGIALICTADSGVIGEFFSVTVAGGLISIFSGIYLSICLYFFYKNNKLK